MAEEKIRRIFLCRHGETESNKKAVYCGGNMESPLTEAGKKQAMLLGKALKEYYEFQGKLIIASPRSRAQETADIISENIEPRPLKIAVEGLREGEHGAWDGKDSEEIQKLFPKKWTEWTEANLRKNFRFPDGESIEEMIKRIWSCFEIVKKIWLGDENETNNDLIIVAHAGTNAIILHQIINTEIGDICNQRSIKQDNACLNIITLRRKNDWRPEIQIALVNSTHHLDLDFPKK